MAGLDLKGVYKLYDRDIIAVNNFNLKIEDKEFIVLVGPSGCGKSTTLRMVAGLEEISAGEVSIGGQVVNDIQPKDRDVAMVFQNYALYPHMTVFENMAFALKLQKKSKEEILERVKTAAKILGIEELLTRKPKELSGGQRQRVAIGRSIVREPKVFLMDEPLSNLDAKMRNQMRAEIIKLHKKLDTTFIYVTHDQIEAMTLGTRIVIMKDGFIQQVGTPKTIFEHPVNLFVAGFIGTPQMNFFETARLVTEGGKYYADVFGKKYLLPEAKQKILKDAGQADQDIIVGLRPEDVDISADTDDSVRAKVDVYELMGSEVYLHVNVICDEGRSEPAVLKVKSHQVSEGDSAVSVLPHSNAIHLFNRETGINLLATEEGIPTSTLSAAIQN